MIFVALHSYAIPTLYLSVCECDSTRQIINDYKLTGVNIWKAITYSTVLLGSHGNVLYMGSHDFKPYVQSSLHI